MERKEHLERLIMGLKQSIESTKFELPYYKPDDLQLVYAKKFLAATEEELARAEKELAAILESPTQPGGNP